MMATRPTALKNPSRTFAPNESRIHDIPPESFSPLVGPSPFTTPVANDGHLCFSEAAMGPASATTEGGGREKPRGAAEGGRMSLGKLHVYTCWDNSDPRRQSRDIIP